jgi:hypothetical protein
MSLGPGLNPSASRRADFHQTPVVHHVADHIGSDPPDGVRGKAHAAVRIEVLHRFHQTHVALLDEVQEVAEGALVLARDHHHEAKIAGDELVRGVDVALLPVCDGEAPLLLAAEQRIPADLGQVSLQRIVPDDRRRFVLLAALRHFLVVGQRRRLVQLFLRDDRVLTFVSHRSYNRSLVLPLQGGGWRRRRWKERRSSHSSG